MLFDPLGPIPGISFYKTGVISFVCGNTENCQGNTDILDISRM
jgi:hypothetical protein